VPVDRHAPIEAFDRIAAEFPVFRITTDPAGPLTRAACDRAPPVEADDGWSQREEQP
jgi:hypothetical protein